jgi:hypothetical protein
VFEWTSELTSTSTHDPELIAGDVAVTVVDGTGALLYLIVLSLQLDETERTWKPIVDDVDENRWSCALAIGPARAGTTKVR